MRYFADTLHSDVSHIQQAAEGIHLGAMAGAVDLVQRALTAIEVSGDVLRLSPQLPEEVDRLDMRIRHRGHSLDLRGTRDTPTVCGHEPDAPPIRLAVKDRRCEFAGDGARMFRLGSAALSPVGSGHS
jgi:trehalose/maltose hydrolase-like predicted phosphorylase